MKNRSGIIIKVLIGLLLLVLILFFIVPDKLKERIITKVERIINKSGNLTDNQLATNAFSWPAGKRCAVSLTFDDGVISQVDKAIPLLDKYGVKATFYVLPGNIKKDLEAWKKAIKNGHDIGNHSILHPCSGNFQWAKQMGHALEDYTTERMHAELDSANKVIKGMLDILPVSFAYPCGQTFLGRGTNTLSYVPLISSMFETGRGYPDESTNDPAFCDMAQLAGMPMDGKSFHEIKKLIESAKNQGSWLILVGHKINEGSNTSQLVTIKAICKYSVAPSNEIWIDNVHNIASFINSKRVRN